LFDSIVIPKMLYGIDIWGVQTTAVLGCRAGRKGQSYTLERVLQTHAISTTGTMQTMTTGVAITHANLTPMPSLLHKHCFQAFLHMSTLSTQNHIHREVH
ncbi:hypothetical protein J3A83DRAFT_4072424, partial [Scleroderma citrinum]